MKKLQKLSLTTVAGLLVMGTLASMPLYATVPGINTLVSVNNTANGQGGNGNSPGNLSEYASISANGKYVVFTSSASDLVAGDTNGYTDVFVRDLVNGSTTRVSVSTSGVQMNTNLSSNSSNHTAISSTGRYIVFSSNATNLIDGQTVPDGQLYMRDMETNTTTLVTQRSDGTIGSGFVEEVGGVSNDGRFVLWKGGVDTNLVATGTTNTSSDYVYMADLKTRAFTLLNSPPATGQYFVNRLTMSCDGSLAAFVTKEQLVSSDTDAANDIYLVDIRNGMTLTGITTSSSNSKLSGSPYLSCNGEYMTFTSKDSTLSALVSPSDTNDHQYLYDRINNTFSIVDTSTSGVIGNDSADDHASVDDRGNVAYTSSSTNLIDGLTVPQIQVYLKHRDTNVTEVVSKPSGSNTSNGVSGHVSISADGRTVVYFVPSHIATNLISSDTNGRGDVIASSTGL